MLKNCLLKLILISILPLNFAWGSACCGGGFAVPSVISGEDKAQLTTSLTHSEVDTDVFADGIWSKRHDKDQTQVLKFEVAHIFNDAFQVGAAVPVVKRYRADLGESSGFSDSSLQLGYEYLPDWDYNPWRPKGIGFITATIPTGKFDITRQENRGRGFWALGLGTLLTKTWVSWDTNTIAEVHRSFERTVDDLKFKPGYGGSFSAGLGYNIGAFRMGGSLMWNYEEAVRTEGLNVSDGSIERYATATIATSYVFENLWSVTASYSDQTLFGDPLTTTLSKSAGLTLQKRWSR